MNFQISVCRTALTSVQLTTKSGHDSATSVPDKVQDVNDLTERLIDVGWSGKERY